MLTAIMLRHWQDGRILTKLYFKNINNDEVTMVLNGLKVWKQADQAKSYFESRCKP